jgi:hypothetical protein
MRLEDGAGQEHPQGLPPDQTDPDHPVADLEDVGQAEVPLHQAQHRLVPGEDHAAQPLEDLPLLIRLGAAGPGVVEGLLGLVEDPPPEPQAGVGAQAGPAARGQHVGDDGAGGDRPELLPLPEVQGVHRALRAMLHLDRPQVEPVLVPEDVQQELGGLGYRAQGKGGVVVALEGEVGHRPKVVEPRAGQQKEVAQHLVGRPE